MSDETNITSIMSLFIAYTRVDIGNPLTFSVFLTSSSSERKCRWSLLCRHFLLRRWCFCFFSCCDRKLSAATCRSQRALLPLLDASRAAASAASYPHRSKEYLQTTPGNH